MRAIHCFPGPARGLRPAAANRGQRPGAGFTFVEIMICTGMIALAASGLLWAMMQATNLATAARTFTGACTVAQNQIDLFLSETPFNATSTPPLIPPDVATTAASGSTSVVTVYQDPGIGGPAGVAVTGTMTVTIANVSPTFAISGTSYSPSVYSSTVNVAWSYRNHNYSVTMNSMRAADN